MNARELSGMLRFLGGKPALVLRDHEQGRIKVFLSGQWVATVIPAHIMGQVGCEAVMLNRDDHPDCEWRGDYGSIAFGLSTFQQTGGDWNAAESDYWDSIDALAELGFA